MFSKKTRKKLSKIVDIILVTYSIIMIAGLILLLYFAWGYWWVNFPWTLDRPARAFYVSIGIAIITIIAQWIEGRFRAILKILKTEKEVNIEWKNTKKPKKMKGMILGKNSRDLGRKR